MSEKVLVFIFVFFAFDINSIPCDVHVSVFWDSVGRVKHELPCDDLLSLIANFISQRRDFSCYITGACVVLCEEMSKCEMYLSAAFSLHPTPVNPRSIIHVVITLALFGSNVGPRRNCSGNLRLHRTSSSDRSSLR